MDHLKRKVCWNTKCPAMDSNVWKEGWRLQSGRIADLCEHCGVVYEQSKFCETFHANDAGWRLCHICKKRVHCGCIASVAAFVHLDYGGIECVSCAKGLVSPSKTMEASGNVNPSTKEESDKRQKITPMNPTQGRQSQDVQSIEDLDKKVLQQSVAMEQGMQQQRATEVSSPTIVPLFEKTLTASDAGRIGRLVLPKACAEAFFPPISSPEGIPIKMNDSSGGEWQFQFRFWPNNSSRMYVLEGITACVRAMELQAGDIVTFSRIDPGGRIVMGYRRSSTSSKSKAKGARDSPVQVRENGAVAKEGSAIFSSPERSSSRATWEEAQDLLAPPPGVTPSVMTIDGHMFEEYEEPPVLARKVY